MLGTLLAVVLATRIGWRLSAASTHLDPAGARTLDKLASLVHKLLYALLIATLVLGIANAWVRGDTLFGLVKIPAFDPIDKRLHETVEEAHGLAANVLLIVALLHAAAALVHRYLLKDGVLGRMLPRR